MAITYTDLDGPDGQQDNMGGTTQRCFIASKADFLSIEKPLANPVTLAASVEINTPHTFKTGKCFTKLYITMDKGKLENKGQGETDGKSFKQEFELFYPGSESKAHGFAAAVKNDNFICMVETPDSDTNGYLQVGTEMFPAKISPEFTLATNSAGVRGYAFKVEAMTARQYVYKSVVSTTPAP